VADSITYQRITLDMESPWNLQGDTVHVWHNKFSLSGSISMAEAEAEATALALWQPIAALVSPKTSLVGWSYYLAGSKTSASGTSYAPGTHAGTRNAYAAGLSYGQQLEVCVLATSAVGKNTRGKQVYLRKWIHDAAASETDPNSIAALNSPSTLFTQWDHGAGPHSCVPVDPTDGTQGAPWEAATHLYTHQLRRGPRRKKAAAGISLLNLAQDAAAAKKILEDIAAGDVPAA
jgi:hypothetical protein